MTQEQRDEGLAQIHDIRRRLAARDFSDIPDDPDAPDAEVVELIDQGKEKQGYDPDHPVMARMRRDIDG